MSSSSLVLQRKTLFGYRSSRGSADLQGARTENATTTVGLRQMLLGKRWPVVALLVVGVALACARRRRRDLGRLLDNLRRYSAQNAVFYDTLTALVLDDFYTRTARELVEIAPRERVLEVGSGPGRLATRLAELAPGVRVTGVDISTEMVEIANALAARSCVADRVEFLVGEAASLPLSDASFDTVVSTFWLHHWASPADGLAEIYRVLRPGGVARVYDVADWIRRFEQGGPSIAEVAKESPFGAHGTFTQRIVARLGPIPLVYGAELIRSEQI
jgi:SAM-dependent methyltransferase